MGILLTRFSDFPLNIQNKIIDFFSPEDFSNHPHLKEINKKIFKILSFNIHQDSVNAPDDHEDEIGAIEFHVFENERRSKVPPFAFNHVNLGRHDRTRFTNEKGDFIRYIPIASYKCPAGYEWIKPNQSWSVDLGYTNTDFNGWSYGTTFDQISENLKHNDSSNEQIDIQVRRKRWFREACKKVVLPNKEEQQEQQDEEQNNISVSFNEPEEEIKREYNPFDFKRNLFKYNSVKDISKYNDMIVFENQRKSREGRFSHNELLKFERSHFSDESGTLIFVFNLFN
jgi:hypothetical protein